MMISCRSIMRIRFWQRDLHFRHGNHRQEANEKQEKRSENPERTGERPDIHPSRIKHSPGRGQEIAMQSADDDDETLEPHAGVHTHADEVNHIDIPSTPAKPEQLRRQAIAEQHADPPVPPIRTEDTVPKSETLI